jgi:acyl-CoA thioester hydrolase
MNAGMIPTRRAPGRLLIPRDAEIAMADSSEIETLHGFPVVISAVVAWGEMDYFRHVNNTVFFRYFESARIAYLERIGFEQVLAESDVGPILASTQARFRMPLSYPDTARVGARVTDVTEDRFTMEYRVFSERHGALAAEGGGVVVAYDYRAGRKAILPEEIRQAIIDLERRTSPA